METNDLDRIVEIKEEDGSNPDTEEAGESPIEAEEEDTFILMEKA